MLRGRLCEVESERRALGEEVANIHTQCEQLRGELDKEMVCTPWSTHCTTVLKLILLSQACSVIDVHVLIISYLVCPGQAVTVSVGG